MTRPETATIGRSGPLFVVDFDHRSDDGPRLCGPFRTRKAAQEWAEAQPIPTAEWSVMKLWIPAIEAPDNGAPSEGGNAEAIGSSSEPQP